MIIFYTVEIDNGYPYEDNYVSVDFFKTYHEAFEYANHMICEHEFNNTDSEFFLKTMCINKTSFDNPCNMNKICLSKYSVENDKYVWKHGLDHVNNNLKSDNNTIDDKFYEYSKEIITEQTPPHYIWNILEERNTQRLEEIQGYIYFCQHQSERNLQNEMDRIDNIFLNLKLSDLAKDYYNNYYRKLINIYSMNFTKTSV